MIRSMSTRKREQVSYETTSKGGYYNAADLCLVRKERETSNTEHRTSNN